MVPRVLVSATSSSSGKTTVVCALAKAIGRLFSKKTSIVKIGPDYIDPLFHSKVVGARTGNIDLFFNSVPDAVSVFERDVYGSDLALLEGAMGFYDGVSNSVEASSFRVAQALECPVLLVVDAKGKGVSICAEIKGIIDLQRSFEENLLDLIPKSRFAVLLNRCSKSSFDSLSKKIAEVCGVETIGFVEDNPAFFIGSRHLGLVTPDAVNGLDGKIEALASSVERTVDFARLFDFARRSVPLSDRKTVNEEEELSRKRIASFVPPVSFVPSVRIAVARDDAFCFYYRENFDMLRFFGAELSFFSPLRNEPVPDGCSGLYIGGGYPELFWSTLLDSRASAFSIRRFCLSGAPVFAECGGFMYLQMLGVLPGSFEKKDRLVRFGYVELEALEDSFLLKKGEKVRGHEFHYFDSTDNGESFKAAKPNGKTWLCEMVASPECRVKKGCGVQLPSIEKNIVAGFPHLYFPSNPSVAENFVDAALFHASVSASDFASGSKLCGGCSGCATCPSRNDCSGCGGCGGCKTAGGTAGEIGEQFSEI